MRREPWRRPSARWNPCGIRSSQSGGRSTCRRRSIGRYLAALGRFVQARPEQVSYLGERTAQQWEAETLWQAVKRLKPNEQEVVYMRYFLDLSEAEMASALGVAPGTVKSRLHRALQHLRGVVDQEFPALREERQT